MASTISPFLANCLRQHCLVASAKPFVSVLALACGWNLLISEPAQSQEQPNSSDDVLELQEVTVFGASRNGRGFLETPSAVTVIGEEDMDRLQPSTYEDLIDAPGVVIQGGRGVAQEPNIRGFQDEQVVIRVDGARQNFDLQHRGRFFVDPALLKQVEILRGGASSMFGTGALGGVISLETKDASDILEPGDTWGGEVNVGFNSQGSEALRSVTTAFAQGNIDMLAFFSQRLMQIDLEDGDNQPILDSAVDHLNGMFKLTFKPENGHKLSFDGRIYNDDGQVPNTANQDTSDASTSTRESHLVDRDLNHQQYSVKWDYAPFDNELVNLSALVYYNQTHSEEKRVNILRREGESERRLDTTEVSTVGVEVTNSSYIDFNEIPVTLSYGLEFFKDDHQASRNNQSRDQHPTAQRSFYAGFAQAEFSFSPAFTLSSGLRYDAFSLDPPDMSDTSDMSYDFSRRNESSLSPWLALNWQPSDHWQFFTSFSQAFRAPTLTEIYATGTHFRVDDAFRIPLPTMGPPMGPPQLVPVDIDNQFRPNPNLKSEKATQVEIGTRYQRSNVAAAGDQLLLSANAYYSSVDNYVETFLPVDITRGPRETLENKGLPAVTESN